MKRFFIFITLLLTLTIAGCSTTSLLSGSNSTIPTGNYFLCDHAGTTGIIVYSPTGEKTAHFPNASVTTIILEDGTYVYSDTGILPEDSILFVEDNVTHAVGVWDVDQAAWILEPTEQRLTCHTPTLTGQMEYFELGENAYNLDFEPIDGTEPTLYPLSDGRSLQNVKEGDIPYIGDENGNYFLGAQRFLSQNLHLDILPGTPRSIELNHTILEKYLNISYSYYITDDQGVSHGNVSSYLCDLSGNILFSEFDYQGVFYPLDQFNNTNRDLLRFIDTDGNTTHYMDLRNESVIPIPAGYQKMRNMSTDLFLLSNENQYTIYNASTKEFGATFSTDLPLNIYVFGLDTYVIQKLNESIIVIDGQLYEPDTPYEIATVRNCHYPVICTGEFLGKVYTSYVVDHGGHLVMGTNQFVTYADSTYYCVCDKTNPISEINIYTYK